MEMPSISFKEKDLSFIETTISNYLEEVAKGGTFTLDFGPMYYVDKDNIIVNMEITPKKSANKISFADFLKNHDTIMDIKYFISKGQMGNARALAKAAHMYICPNCMNVILTGNTCLCKTQQPKMEIIYPSTTTQIQVLDTGSTGKLKASDKEWTVVKREANNIVINVKNDHSSPWNISEQDLILNSKDIIYTGTATEETKEKEKLSPCPSCGSTDYCDCGIYI